MLQPLTWTSADDLSAGKLKNNYFTPDKHLELTKHTQTVGKDFQEQIIYQISQVVCYGYEASLYFC